MSVRGYGSVFRSFAWIALPLCLAGALIACSAEPELCEVCKREIHPGVAAELTLAGGRQVWACCLRCALHFKESIETPVQRIDVEDHTGSGLLDVAAAYVVEGSRLNPCMPPAPREGGTRVALQLAYDRCVPSMIAFREEEDARAFLAEQGGTLQPPGHFTDSGALRR